MEVRAIIIVGARPESLADTQAEMIGGVPIALNDVLGRPVVYRLIDRLRANDITAVSVISEVAEGAWPTASHRDVPPMTWYEASGEKIWRTAEQVFNDYAQSGADTVLVLRVGAYTDINYDDLVQFHIGQSSHVTSVVDPSGTPLEIYAITASRRNDAAFLLRHQLQKARASMAHYTCDSYCNRLQNAHDLRQLAVDGFMQRVEIEPAGKQIRPGVWVAPGARIHKTARVLSPAFVGGNVRVRAAAVITRCSSLEHHTIVDCGTVVENVSVLPYTYVGAGLDLAHAVVGYRRLWHLKRAVEVAIDDPKLVGMASPHAPLRALASAASLASFIPAQVLRGLFAPSHRECPTSIPDAIKAPSSALKAPHTVQSPAPSVDAGEFPANLMIARRYGNE